MKQHEEEERSGKETLSRDEIFKLLFLRTQLKIQRAEMLRLLLNPLTISYVSIPHLSEALFTVLRSPHNIKFFLTYS